MAEQPVHLGYRVRDKISGYEGVVTTIAYHLTGCERYGVYPWDVDDSTRRGEEEFFYHDQLTVIDDDNGLVENVRDEATETDFELGERARDRVTGVTGLVTTITFNLYNCPRHALQPVGLDNEHKVKDKEERQWFDENRLERVDEGVSEKFDLTEVSHTNETGAPAQDVQRKTDQG